ncbi:MAG: MBL fold metallo-hydrolase [Synergistaceae bacterium]|nr:MBL fold metallo-hydrolase [Synergistaceae bacterium]MBQ6435685.1 MBL fold metallo-hydrolase [Synergistaceae bacterium]MBQ6738266.1 MBL fold metallo-hydrolase [Synergistaceae bacterium]MBQ7068936.1 MBL fold metallo-hydrolase [Synergistaceae bacterium]MBR0075942.1 MBL fold metallo-hydrolase [Synergistaceae bacterium]
MKKIFFMAVSFVFLFAVSVSANAVSVGDVNVYNFDGGLKLHAYSTNDNMNDHCYVVETPEGLVLIESTAYKENVNALNDYIKSLGKPLTAALLSYHPNGYKTYGEVKIYATENALKSWGEGGSVNNLTKSFIQALGDKVADDLPEKAEIVEEGQTLNLAGIDFKILHSSDGEDYDIEIPAINTIYRHMMGAKTHNILVSVPYIEAEIADLKNYQAKNYSLILTSHNAPENQKDVAEKIAYLEKVLQLATSGKNKDEFLAGVKAAFPDYNGEAYLEMSAGALFAK